MYYFFSEHSVYDVGRTIDEEETRTRLGYSCHYTYRVMPAYRRASLTVASDSWA